MKKILLLVCGILIVAMANAVANVQLDENGMPIRVADRTPCATAAFERGLANNIDEIKAADPQNMTELEAEHWVRRTLFKADILKEVLNCPEVKSAPDDKEIKFETIKCTLPNGTVAQLNFNSTPEKLRQHADLNAKRERLARDPNPEIDPENGTDIWTNTNPGWYALMAVRTGALDEYVGPDKNNTIGLEYIRANIDSLFPTCAPDSALAADNNVFNKGVYNTIGMGDDDSNDYYVAGDVDLRWITYLEIAADVVLTIVSWGAWSGAKGATQMARSGDLINDATKAIKTARKSQDAAQYLAQTVRAANLADAMTDTKKTIEALETAAKTLDDVPDVIRGLSKNQADELIKLRNKISETEKQMKSAKGQKKAAEYRKKIKNLQNQRDNIMNKHGIKYQDLKYLDRGTDVADKQKELDQAKDFLAQLQKESDDVAKQISKLEDTDDVKRLKELGNTRDQLIDLQKGLRALSRPRTGNIFVRAGKTFKTIWSKKTNKIIDKARKTIGGASTRSAKLRDWLFHSTMKNAGAISGLGAKAGLWYGALKFIGGMWDYTDVSTGDFTNGVEFSPLLLVSADDIKGQENVVNHGMWFMWVGDSVVAADDDAAYLQAMDFAAKLHQTLNDGPSCPMDLYVVRPLLRNPGTPNASVYYLIMNDEPWTVD